MTDILATFADQVTTVARWREGCLGGWYTARAAGTWKALTVMSTWPRTHHASARNAARDRGDFGRPDTADLVEARAPSLKDNINTMIDNLRSTKDCNIEQDWLKTNLAPTNMLQGQRDLSTAGRLP